MSRATSVDMATTITMVCDVMDVFPDQVRLLESGMFADFGGLEAFHGTVSTIKCFEDNSLVGKAVAEPGDGRVLVIDGGGSLRASLMGGQLAQKAASNGWAGVVIYGALRDVAELGALDIGIKALSPCPRSTDKRGLGDRDVAVTFAGQTIKAGDYLYADGDGIIIADRPLHTA